MPTTQALGKATLDIASPPFPYRSRKTFRNPAFAAQAELRFRATGTCPQNWMRPKIRPPCRRDIGFRRLRWSTLMTAYQVVLIAEKHISGFRAAVDVVARS
jgi:hypothetical protein